MIAVRARGFYTQPMHLAVEGCIGAGKTTIARALAGSRNAFLLEENFESNPFIRAFYEDPAKYVVEAEFGFLLIHYHQLLCASVKPDQDLVSDFLFEKDLIYADLNFPDSPEKKLFQDLHRALTARLRRPDLVIFLSAPDELISERIKRRQRDYEQAIDFGYYRRLNAAYEMFFQGYNGAPVLTVQVGKCDFLKDSSLAGMLSQAADDAVREQKSTGSFPPKQF